MKTKYLFIFFIAYTGLLIYWMLYGFGRSPQLHYQYNITPLATIIEMFQHYSLFSRALLINIVGNIIVFVPFGMLLPALIRKKRIVLLAVFLTGITIMELSQLLLRRGSFDIDDYFLNSIGFIIGYIIYRCFHKSKDKGRYNNE